MTQSLYYGLSLVAALILGAMISLSGCTSNSSAQASRANLTAHAIEGTPMPLSTGGHVGGSVNGIPVIGGGTSWSADKTTKRWNRESFSFSNGKWMPGPDFPQAMADSSYASAPDGLYVAGGTDGKNPTNLVLHLASTSPNTSWERLTPLPAPIDSAAGAYLSNSFYVVGGFSNGKASNELWALDTRTPGAKWRSLAPLPAPGRGYPAFVEAGGALYLFGGFTQPPYQKQAEIFSDAWRYNPDADQWTHVEGFNLPGYAWTATAISPHQIMLTGHVPKISIISDEILLIDLRDNSIRPIGKLVLPTCCAPSIKVGAHTWWIVGGEPATDRSRTERVSIITLKD